MPSQRTNRNDLRPAAKTNHYTNFCRKSYTLNLRAAELSCHKAPLNFARRTQFGNRRSRRHVSRQGNVLARFLRVEAAGKVGIHPKWHEKGSAAARMAATGNPFCNSRPQPINPLRHFSMEQVQRVSGVIDVVNVLADCDQTEQG